MGLFGQIFNSKSKNKTSSSSLAKTSRADEIRITETLGLRRLESMPVQAAKAFQLSCDPKSTLDDFVKIIESDEVLSARIMKIANSVYFRRGDQAKDISRAVANIGLNEIKCLLSAAMLKSLLKGNSKMRNVIWGNSVATALTTKHLSMYTNIPEGEAFLCGLLHDVGKLIMLQRSTPKYEKLMQVFLNSSRGSVVLEEEGFDLTHIELGKWLAEKWSFPESVRRAITFHHHRWPDNPNELGKKTSPAMLVKCADTIAHANRLGHNSSHRAFGTKCQIEKTAILNQLQISESDLENIEKTVSRLFESEISLYSMGGS